MLLLLYNTRAAGAILQRRKNPFKGFVLFPVRSRLYIRYNSLISLDTKFCTPWECMTSPLRNCIFFSESDCNKFVPLAIVLATSNDSIDILFPLEPPVRNPLLVYKFDTLLPNVSKTPTAFSRSAIPALPINEFRCEIWNSKTAKLYHTTNASTIQP